VTITKRGKRVAVLSPVPKSKLSLKGAWRGGEDKGGLTEFRFGRLKWGHAFSLRPSGMIPVQVSAAASENSGIRRVRLSTFWYALNGLFELAKSEMCLAFLGTVQFTYRVVQRDDPPIIHTDEYIR
jgi:antitoxin (DNA-binding transcriptional repressor) of toxin-antitoxin stability system